MIPPLDERGLLPAGTHECQGLAELALHFATNARRVRLMERLVAFVRDELAPVASGLDLYVGGSYLSDKANPSDIDCTVILGFDQLLTNPGLLSLAGAGGKGRIHQQYEVEFYPTFRDNGGNDFRLFFAYAGDKTAQAKNIDAKDLRGIVKVNAWTPAQ